MTEAVFEGAFPSGCMSIGDGDAVAYERGMSLRDYFAGQALAGLLASGPHDCEADGIAHDAYLHADAMLAARGRSTK